jgi:beta-N-acetylglucosaminidase
MELTGRLTRAKATTMSQYQNSSSKASMNRSMTFSLLQKQADIHQDEIAPLLAHAKHLETKADVRREISKNKTEMKRTEDLTGI